MKKLVNVVMLPTTKISSNELYFTKRRDYKIENDSKCPVGTLSLAYAVNENFWEPQHLYLTSDEEIKEGDWIRHSNNDIGIVSLINKDGTYEMKLPDGEISDNLSIVNGKKIIATTDKLVVPEKSAFSSKVTFLPRIPKSFIKAYVESQGNIKEVDIEYIIEYPTGTHSKYDLAGIYVIKTRPDNTVIIHQAKTYIRDEVIKLIHKYTFDFGTYPLKEDVNKWIEENL